jgi:hypothetical protein
MEDLVHFWERAGFNMKTFVRTRVLEFTGFKIPIVDGCIKPDLAVPDFIRNMHAASVTTSPQARETADSWKAVASSKYLSYALSLHKLPTLSRMFLRWASELSPIDDIFNAVEDMTHEDKMRLGVRDTDGVHTVITHLNNPDFEREERILGHLGILRGCSYHDFCVNVENQLREAPNSWLSSLSYYE